MKRNHRNPSRTCMRKTDDSNTYQIELYKMKNSTIQIVWGQFWAEQVPSDIYENNAKHHCFLRSWEKLVWIWTNKPPVFLVCDWFFEVPVLWFIWTVSHITPISCQREPTWLNWTPTGWSTQLDSLVSEQEKPKSAWPTTGWWVIHVDSSKIF